MDQGRFRFTRTGSTSSSLTVAFTTTGTATSGTDYQALPATVVIPSGASFVDVFVTPLRDDDSSESSESVVVTVTDGPPYDLGAASTATVNITQ